MLDIYVRLLQGSFASIEVRCREIQKKAGKSDVLFSVEKGDPGSVRPENFHMVWVHSGVSKIDDVDFLGQSLISGFIEYVFVEHDLSVPQRFDKKVLLDFHDRVHQDERRIFVKAVGYADRHILEMGKRRCPAQGIEYRTNDFRNGRILPVGAVGPHVGRGIESRVPVNSAVRLKLVFEFNVCFFLMDLSHHAASLIEHNFVKGVLYRFRQPFALDPKVRFE